jgi:hypothetical protein
MRSWRGRATRSTDWLAIAGPPGTVAIGLLKANCGHKYIMFLSITLVFVGGSADAEMVEKMSDC